MSFVDQGLGLREVDVAQGHRQQPASYRD